MPASTEEPLSAELPLQSKKWDTCSVFLRTLLLLFIKKKRFSKEICTRYRMHQLFHLKHPSSSSDRLSNLYMFPVLRECCYLREQVAQDSPLHLSGRIGLS